MRLLSSLVIVLTIVGFAHSPANSAEPISPRELRTAIGHSVRFLEDDMRQWRTVRKCGACHHAPLALTTLREAEKKGIEIDQSGYVDLRHWSLTNDRARLVPEVQQDSNEKPKLSLQSVYLAWALAIDSSADDNLKQVRERIGAHWEATRQTDGFWQGPVGHPPVFASPTEITLMMLLAAEAQPLISSESRRRAEAWLEQQPVSNSHQELVLRILWSQRMQQWSDVKRHVAQLLSLQQSDGGWRQTVTLPSDAFATGQALVALAAAGIPTDEVSIQRAAKFLVTTQNTDGTWTMISRPDPDDGKPADNLNPITYAGTAWATRGLLTLLDRD